MKKHNSYKKENNNCYNFNNFYLSMLIGITIIFNVGLILEFGVMSIEYLIFGSQYVAAICIALAYKLNKNKSSPHKETPKIKVPNQVTFKTKNGRKVSLKARTYSKRVRRWKW